MCLNLLINPRKLIFFLNHVIKKNPQNATPSITNALRNTNRQAPIAFHQNTLHSRHPRSPRRKRNTARTQSFLRLLRISRRKRKSPRRKKPKHKGQERLRDIFGNFPRQTPRTFSRNRGNTSQNGGKSRGKRIEE